MIQSVSSSIQTKVGAQALAPNGTKKSLFCALAGKKVESLLSPASSGRKIPSPHVLRLARFLRRQRDDLAAAIFDHVGIVDEWRLLTDEHGMDRDQIVRNMIGPLIDFLALYLRSGQPIYRDLFIGGQLKILNDLEKIAEPQSLSVGHYHHAFLDSMCSAFANQKASQRGLAALLRAILAELMTEVATPCPKHCKILLIGDCLYDEFKLLLNAQAVQVGLKFTYEHIHNKNPAEQRQLIKNLDMTPFECVFFSPFTYEFGQHFKAVLVPRNGFLSQVKIEKILHETRQEIAKTIDLLLNQGDAPIFVHNASTIQRGRDALTLFIKLILTARARHRVKKPINAWLNDYAARRNAASFKRIFVLDESSLVRNFLQSLNLGKYLSTAETIHPTFFSHQVALLALDKIEARLRLINKKIIVCDLDNTLWEGVIGEGEGVKHHHDRQHILLELKKSGVVLAINSKNDEHKVQWDGATLKADDFVSAAISWQPKVYGMKRIQEDVNLKFKDFVFIDDRHDERALIQEAYPDITVMDANDPRTFRLLAEWNSQLDVPELDRTQMYKDREQRKALESCDNPDEMFAKLELKVTIGKASPTDLRRITELINRTNQWNVAGSQVTLKQIKGLHASPHHALYVVHAADKFGPMGMVCCCVVEETSNQLFIPLFVLSCRVFGYGIEKALMDRIKKDALGRYGRVRVSGIFIKTPHNQPAAGMFEDNGFTKAGDLWLFDSPTFTPMAPSWLMNWGP